MNDSIEKSKYGRISTIVYAVMLGDLQQVARDNGYALAVHGSLNRDFDIVAIPWTDAAIPAEDLVTAMARALRTGPITEPELKPHGRVAWSICLECGYYIDLSVMPLLKNKKAQGDGNDAGSV